MRSSRLIATTLTAGLALTGLLAGPTAASATTPAATSYSSGWSYHQTRSFSTDGVVSTLDAPASTVTLDRFGVLSTYTVDPAATVTVDRVAATLADVPAGSLVRIRGTVRNGTSTVTSIAATTTWPLRTTGLVDAIDPAALTIAIDHDGDLTTADIDPAATVTIDGVSATIADVPVGAKIRVRGTVTNSAAVITAIDAVTTWRFSLEGVIGAVDTAGGTITLAGIDNPFDVSPTATITRNRTAVDLTALRATDRVLIFGTATTTDRTVTRITARSWPVRSARHHR